MEVHTSVYAFSLICGKLIRVISFLYLMKSLQAYTEIKGIYLFI